MSMAKFTYRSGQRPLDGFTLKRGVGQGGFGEVYLAVSDGGKEVALKLLHKHADIELRGVEPCLNIKHPNLLHLYDMRKDSRGQHWLVMEYIIGESLSQVLNREPNGLPTELARDWFLALGRAVNHLHEHGIVHRDLKPANIFIEHGQLKVGDYGLCKALSESKAAHTSNVGTVHYMAPEISRGEYNKQIDIYACGVILFEMLTGRLPFDGESVGEILMKHLTDSPDFTGVPDAYKPIVHKALDKIPARRYANMTEMMRAVENLSRPANVFLPVTLPGNAVVEPYGPRPNPPATPSRPVRALRLKDPPTSIPLTPREKLSELATALAVMPFLALVPVLLYRLYWQTTDVVSLGRLYFLTVAVCAAILVPAKLLKPRDTGVRLRRLAMAGAGAAIGVLAFWLHGWTPEVSPSRFGESWSAGLGISEAGKPLFVGYVVFFAVALGAVRWWKFVARERADWFSFFPVLPAAIVGGGALFAFQGIPAPASVVLVLVSAAMITQVVSAWQPIVTAPKPRKLRLSKSRTPVPNAPLEETITG